MKIKRPDEFEGGTGKPGAQFTGEVFAFVTMTAAAGMTINTVNFTPGARTHWHFHEKGQILQVLAGCGYVATAADGIHVIRAGDIVWCPPGENHWHGAAPDSFMTHTAISLGKTNWSDPVAEHEYTVERGSAEKEGI